MKKNLLTTLLIVGAFMSKAGEKTSLKEAYKDHFLIGNALPAPSIVRSSPVQLLNFEQCNYVVAENAMKWHPTEPKEGKFNLKVVDKLVALAEKHNAKIHGHVLVWHCQTPKWVFEGSREDVLKRMKNHIDAVAGRYKGKIYAWDVVNEAFGENGELRDVNWRKKVGDDYIKQAFIMAAKADPNALLGYNDFGMTGAKKVNAVVNMVKEFKKEGIKIDFVGMQSHYRLGSPSTEDIEKSIIKLHKAGVKVAITELDVDVLPAAWKYRGADINVRFKLQDKLNPYTKGLPKEIQKKLAKRYADIFRIFKKHSDKIMNVTFWGMSDGDNWKNNFPVKGRTNYPTLFNRKYQPKPAFHAVIDVAKEK